MDYNIYSFIIEFFCQIFRHYQTRDDYDKYHKYPTLRLDAKIPKPTSNKITRKSRDYRHKPIIAPISVNEIKL